MPRTPGTRLRTRRAYERLVPPAGRRAGLLRPTRAARWRRPTRALPRPRRPRSRPRRSRASLSWSLAGELRIPLLAERGQALAEVLGTRRQLERERLVAQVLVERRVASGVQQPLHQAERDRRPRREPVGEVGQRAVEVAGRDRGMDRAPCGRLCAGELTAEQQQLARPHLSDAPGEQ